MSEYTDGLEDALSASMPTIPKHETDVVAAKDIEGHSASTGYRTVIPRASQAKADAIMLDNMLTADDRGVPTPDAVVLPAHYARYKIEPIRFLVENFGPVILVGKVVKYTMRYDAKNGMEDLRKAQRCLEMLIKYNSGDPDWWKR